MGPGVSHGFHTVIHSLLLQLRGLGSSVCDVSVGMASPRHIGYAGTRISRHSAQVPNPPPTFKLKKPHTVYDDLGDGKVMVMVESKVRLSCVIPIPSSLHGLRFHLNSF